MHPGKEHKPEKRSSMCSWTTGEHRRKFLEHRGIWLDRNESPKQALLRFWGEYEPPTGVESLDFDGMVGLPRLLHRPLIPMGPRPRGGQNTDPWVFGGFYYSNCQQWRKTGRTQLRNLLPGSIILFGSQLHGKFVLDTCFVIAEYLDFDRASAPAAEWDLPPKFREAVLDPIAYGVGSCGRGRDRRLYKGVQWVNGIKEPYSFVPCLSIEAGQGSFPRPVIRGRFISDDKRQGYSLKSDPVSVWTNVRDQVLDAGLTLGVKIDGLDSEPIRGKPLIAMPGRCN